MACGCPKSITVALLIVSANLNADPLFDSDDAIELDLTGPFSEISRDTDERPELPFVLRAEGVEHEVKVRVRGKSRLELCKFPPLRINFKKSKTGDTVFSGQNKLKMVVPCRFSTRSLKDVLKEYAIYRMFELVTDASYRVRLLSVAFIEPGSRSLDGSERHYAFFLESRDRLADRLGGVEALHPEVALAWFDQRQLALMFVFQYMVGNVDWSLVRPYEDPACCHNGTLVETGEKLFYVPYDFDLSEFVDVPYAGSEQSLPGGGRGGSRRYLGFCIDSDYVRDAIRTIREHEEEILGVIAELPLLSEKDKNSRTRYLSRFFKSAADEERMLRNFEKRCKS